MTTFRILVFEDESDAARSLAQAFGSLLEKDEKIDFLWFCDGFNPREKNAPIYPIEVEPDYEPLRLQIEASKDLKEWPPEIKGNRKYWQEEFDAAILDIYLEGEDGPIEGKDEPPAGYEYAQWFALAEFRGPIRFITRKTHPPEKFKQFKVTTKDEDPIEGIEHWTIEAARFVLQELRQSGSRDIQGRFISFHVNYRGRDPETFLSRFDETSLTEQAARKQRIRPEPWDSIHFITSDTDVEAEELCRFLRLNRYEHQGCRIFPLQRFHETLEIVGTLQGQKPKVVWIDYGAGSTFDNECARGLLEDGNVFKPYGSASTFNPIFIILADYQHLRDPYRKLFARCNAFIAERSHILRYPSDWIGEKVTCLAEDYWRFSEAISKAEREETGTRMKLSGEWNDHIALKPEGYLMPKTKCAVRVVKKKGSAQRLELPNGFHPKAEVWSTVKRNDKKDEQIRDWSQVEGKIFDWIHIPARRWPPHLRDAASLVINSLPPALIAAKATYRIHGSGNQPVSLAAWISAEAASRLNSAFDGRLHEAANQLREEDEISEHQALLFAKSLR